MLTTEQNMRITHVGPCTPMGELMRRYWHPIAPAAELDERPTKAVRLLGEDLMLYKDNSGTYGLIDRYCPHRRVDMSYGIPEQHGLRCMYHGWMFDETGACTEQPFEETVHPDGRFKEKTGIAGYPVQALGGLLFAYMGPAPAPLLPEWDLFVRKDAVRTIGVAELPANWLQCMENSADPVHTEWLHGAYMNYVVAQAGGWSHAPSYARRHQRIGFDRFPHGLIKRRLLEGQSEDDAEWRIGHPLVFPNVLRVGGTGMYEFQYRVPVDDVTTLHIWYTCHVPRVGERQAPQDSVPYHRVPIRDEAGFLIGDFIDAQDVLAWVGAGPIVDRSREALGESDRGVILYRQMLEEGMAAVEAGREPMNVFREPGSNQNIPLPQEENKFNTGRTYSDVVFNATHVRYSPILNDLKRLFGVPTGA